MKYFKKLKDFLKQFFKGEPLYDVGDEVVIAWKWSNTESDWDVFKVIRITKHEANYWFQKDVFSYELVPAGNYALCVVCVREDFIIGRARG